MEDAAAIRIWLAIDHTLTRQAIRSALESEPDLRVVSESRPGLRSLSEAEDVRPNVAVLEVVRADREGIRTVRALRERLPDCRILLLSEGERFKTLIEGLEAGASGYVSKEAPLTELVGATRSVMGGECVIPRSMLAGVISLLLQRRREHDENLARAARLSTREREILRLLADGADNETIGRFLLISPETVRTHVQNIFSKLGVHSRLEAVAKARDCGVFDEPATDPAGDRHPSMMTG